MPISITINGDKRVLLTLDGLSAILKNGRKIMSDVGDAVISEFEANFPAEGARLGEPWKPLTPGTIRQRIAMGYGGAHTILERTGRLRHGFVKEVSDMQVKVSNPVPYFRYHQLGEGFNPKRRMIVASENLKQEIVSIIHQGVRDTLK